jgi:hypothetical protein
LRVEIRTPECWNCGMMVFRMTHRIANGSPSNTAKENTMPASTVSYGEFEIAVHTERNQRHAWIASVSVTRGDRTVVSVRPATVQPEWLTEEEAIRDGIEWGRRFIDHEFNTPQSRSWVAERAHAETWFRDVEEPPGSETSA